MIPLCSNDSYTEGVHLDSRVAIGNNRIGKDPDRRIVESLTLVFAKFTEMQSVRQVHLWLRNERVSLPTVTYGAKGRGVEWKLPVYNTILTNPICAMATITINGVDHTVDADKACRYYG